MPRAPASLHAARPGRAAERAPPARKPRQRATPTTSETTDRAAAAPRDWPALPQLPPPVSPRPPPRGRVPTHVPDTPGVAARGCPPAPPARAPTGPAPRKWLDVLPPAMPLPRRTGQRHRRPQAELPGRSQPGRSRESVAPPAGLRARQAARLAEPVRCPALHLRNCPALPHARPKAG